jgi:ParB family chromosome partitioning protein
MTIQLVELKHLHVSPLNMRAEKKVPSLKRMAEIAANILPTIREKGIQTALIVRPNADGMEILAGRRRYYAARVIENETGAFPPVACDVREGIDDAAAMEISLIENVAREDADELTCYETYSALIRQGRAVAEIARLFGKKDREITQCLAIANLLPRIRDLYRDEQLDGSNLQLLTMATKTQQRDWLKLWDDNDAPTHSDLKHWLFGGVAIRADYALFDLAPFKDKIVGDLFSKERYFQNPQDFWTAQDQEIAKRRDTYLAAKWCEVVVLERGKQFPQWDFVKASKKEGGRVYIEPTHTGEVRFHEGYLTQREIRNAEKQARRAKTKDGKAEAGETRSPITNTLHNYLDLHRHAVVRLAVLKHPKDALRLLIAHAVAASGNWSVKPDAQRADSNAVRESLTASPAQATFAAEARKVRALLAPAFKGMERDDNEGAARVCGNRNDDALTLRVFHRLLKLRDADVLRIAAFAMAETLQSGSNVVDGFGVHAKVKTRDHWTPDAAFFDLLRDRQSVNTMLADVAGKKLADTLVTAKLKDNKAALAKAAAEAPAWCPGWMAFPATP